MNIDNFKDAVKACRFCFMCRHLSGVGNVSFREADTPRVRAAFIDGIMRDKALLANPDFIQTVYRSDLSAACRFHCVNGFDENGLLLAARRDIVEAGLAPQNVSDLADMVKAKFEAPVIRGDAPVAYLSDWDNDDSPSEKRAFDKIMKKAGMAYSVCRAPLEAKILKTLGYNVDAKAMLEVFAESAAHSKVKIFVTSNPAVYDLLVNDAKEFGIAISKKIMHSSEYICSLKLKYAKKPGKIYYLESDFLKNYCGSYKFPGLLLANLKAELANFGTNAEESYTCAEGAVVLDKLYPEIVKKLAKYVEARADNPKSDKIITASPYTKARLQRNSKLNVSTLVELAAECL